MGRKSARSLDAAEDSSCASDSEMAAGGSPDAGSSAEDIAVAEGSSLAIKAGGSGSSIGLRKLLRQGRRPERS